MGTEIRNCSITQTLQIQPQTAVENFSDGNLQKQFFGLDFRSTNPIWDPLTTRGIRWSV